MSTTPHHRVVRARPLPGWHRTAPVTAGLALAVSMVSGCGGGPGTTAVTGTRSHPRPVTATVQAAGASHGLAGHGELAFIAHGHLYLAGGPAGTLRPVSLPGVPSTPAWSTDHRWLAVQVAKPPPRGNPFLWGPAALWVVRAAGTGARRLTPPSWDVSSFAWSPRTSLLAVGAGLAPQDRSAVVATVGLSGTRKILATSSDVSGVAWSPGGTRIAAGVSVYTGRPGWQSRLELMSPAGGPPAVVTSSKGNVLELAGWWPAGSGLLYWTDPQGSGSIAADGLPLDAVPVTGHRSRQLVPVMLVHGSWLAFTPGGRTVAVVVGDDRVIWAGHKQITICHPTGGCFPVGQAPGVVSLDPSWSPGGTRLVFARASATGPFGRSGHADFSPYWIRRWQATSRLWVASAYGSSAKPLAAAGQGALDPAWGSDGSLLFVRDDSIWLLPPGAARPVRVTGPLGAFTGLAYDQTYYGYVPYPRLIAWTLARPSATAGSG
jgi:Tol biopolymer transport system component